MHNTAEVDTDVPPPQLSPFAQVADELIAAGWPWIVPIKPGEKYPGRYDVSGQWEDLELWQAYSKHPATEGTRAWWATWPDAGIGVVLGACVEDENSPDMRVVCVDIDSTDPDVVEKIKGSLPSTDMAKIGKKGISLFYRSAVIPKKRIYKGADGKPIVEILSDRNQTVLPPTVHPETGRPYVGIGKIVPPSELPDLDADHLARFEDTLKTCGWSGAATVAPDNTERGGWADYAKGGDSWSVAKAAAMENFARWVPALGLPKTKPRGQNAWEAVATWRPSGSGKQTRDRNPNLKFYRTGIKDMGTDVGYSPIDVVMHARGLSENDALKWLQDRLGIVEETLPYVRFNAGGGTQAEWDRFVASRALEFEAEQQRARDALHDDEVVDDDGAWTGETAGAEPPTAVRRLITFPLYDMDDVADDIERRKWLYGKFLIRGELSITVAPGGVGKTALGLCEAVAMATGRPLLGVPIEDGPLRCMYWSGEEPEHELRRRLFAIRKYYGIEKADYMGRLFVGNSKKVPLIIAKQTRKDGPIIQWPIVGDLIAELKEKRIDVFTVDPYISTHNCTENDTEAMQLVATLWKNIGEQANCATSLHHHTRKEGGGRITADSGRGSGATQYKGRVVRSLNWMTEKEAKKLGISRRESLSIYNVSDPDGKVNMTPRDVGRQWFKNQNVALLNNRRGPLDPGDEVGVTVRWTPPAIADLDPDVVAAFVARIETERWLAAPQNHTKREWVGNLIAELFELEKDAEGEWKARAKEIWKEIIVAGEAHINRERGSNRHGVGVARPGPAPGEDQMGDDGDEGQVGNDGDDDDDKDQGDGTEAGQDDSAEAEAGPFAGAQERLADSRRTNKWWD